MDDQQWTTLIQELKDAINNAKDTQVRLTANADEYSKTINNGFKLIQDTIHDIDGLIGQLTELINGLTSRIDNFEANKSADQTPKLTTEIAELQKQLSDAQEIQRAAVAAMQNATVALNANNEAMNTSIGKQDVAGLNTIMTATTTSLEDIKTKLQALLNKTPTATPVNPGNQQNNPLTDDTEFELPDSGVNITYSNLKQLVKNKIDQESKKNNGVVPRFYIDLSYAINAVNATQDGIQTAIDKMPFDKNGQLQGGKHRSRKNKITKKQRKLRRNKTIKKKRKPKYGYRHYTKRRISRL